MTAIAPARSRAAPLAALFVLVWLPARAQDQKPGYAGSEACQLCHEDIHKAFQKNRHAVLETDKIRGWQTRSCESCHGPGAKHAESASAADIRQPAKQRVPVADAGCLTCHLNQPTHVGRVQGGHAKNQVACVGCHAVHKAPPSASTPGSGPVLALSPAAGRNARQTQQCAGCHQAEWSSFLRPHKHPLAEGAMACLDCHNPHGSLLPRNVLTASGNEPGCFRCHGDKRGPFVFEHAPVRLEGCQSCHEPHGSANPRMLRRHDVQNLCLECHSNLASASGGTQTGALGGVPPAIHDLRNPRYRNCTICHMKIHGSHVNRDFLR